MTEQIPKPVDMHEAFKRYPVKRGAEKIAYVRLHGVAADARMSEPRLFNAFLRSPEGSVDEETFAHWTAVGNLVLTAQQLQRASGELKRIISERFTQMTVELYGKPSAEIAGQLIAEQLNGLEPLVGNNDVDQARLSSTIGFLREQLGDAEISEVPDNNFEDVLEQVGTYIRERFGPILESLWREGEPADKKISAQEVAERFQRGIDMLAEDDPAWKDWHSEVTQDSSAETITRRKFIGVGQNSRAVSSLAVTFTHEAIGHALRSINGGKTGDEKLEHGMPGSHRSEEGVAVLLASGIRGRLSEASKDFYMEIAVALGQFGQPMVTRAQMQKFCLDREVIRTQAKGKPVEEKPLSDKTWGHVNRIYRGSLGNEEVAVNTYETVYYGGFRPIAEYVRKQLAAGRSMDGIFGELTCARIDPTNPQDIEYRDGVIDNGDQDG